MTARRLLEPSGVHTLLGAELEALTQSESRVQASFHQAGYHAVRPPTLEYLDLFRDEDGDSDRMVKMVDRDGRVLVLRPDATVPVSRLASRLCQDSSGPVKLCYVTTIFRWGQGGGGDQLETRQAGIELFNDPSASADADVLVTGVTAVASAGVPRVQTDMGHAGWLRGLRETANVPPDTWAAVLGALEVRSPERVRAVLREEAVTDQVLTLLEGATQLHGEPASVLAAAAGWVRNSTMAAALANLEAVVRELSARGMGVQLDLGFMNPSRYYTGVMFQAYTPAVGQVLLQGGRYDELTARFGPSVPACGLGVNLTQVADLLLFSEDR